MTRKFKKINDRLYDNGIKLSKSHRLLFLEMTNFKLANKIAMRTHDDNNLDQDSARWVEGLVEPESMEDKYSITIIDKDAARELTGPFDVYIREKVPNHQASLTIKTEAQANALWHWPAETDSGDPDRKKEGINLDIEMPIQEFENMWGTLKDEGTYTITIAVYIEVFQSDMEASFREPWDKQYFFIESESCNSALLKALYVTKNIEIVTNNAALNTEAIDEPEESDDAQEDNNVLPSRSDHFIDSVFPQYMQVLHKELGRITFGIWVIIMMTLIMILR